MKRLTKIEAEGWIAENAPRYCLIEWGGKANENSTFLDRDRAAEFSMPFSRFKYDVLNRPNITLGATKGEISEKRNKTYSKEKREDAVKKRNKTNVDRYGVENTSSLDFVKEKTKQTNLEKYGTIAPGQNPKILAKIKQTNIEKFGHESPLSNCEVREKIKQTILERYGVETPMESEGVRNKTKQTNMERYGVNTPTKNEAVKMKIKQTYLDRYGFVGNFNIQSIQLSALMKLKSKNVLDKRKATNLKKYGVENISEDKKFIDKTKNTKIKNGHIKLIDGKTLREISQEKNVGYTTIQSLFLKTKNEDLVKEYTLKKTSIEQVVEKILKRNKIDFVFSKSLGGKFKPDFLIESKKLAIECNGLYWHSDMICEDKNYHSNKKIEYRDLGYTSLFFDESEILEKTDIVESIIINKLGLITKKVGARKCNIKKLSAKDAKKFFDQNHLMGGGSGQTFVLEFEGRTVAAIRARWKNKAAKTLEISRFCTAQKVSVSGGFSRLLKHAIEEFSPNLVENFIDERYGEGLHLSSLGFQKVTSSLSFRWTNFKKTFHRMNFKGNSGYAAGMYKIWDCGQTKWELKCGE